MAGTRVMSSHLVYHVAQKAVAEPGLKEDPSQKLNAKYSKQNHVMALLSGTIAKTKANI
jgi:hypothetical protein